MAFAFVLLALGIALVTLLTAARSGTELERKEVKAFNVAEAGVDAGMFALKNSWPEYNGESAAVAEDDLKAELQSTNPGLWDPRRSAASEFIDVSIYDNVDEDGDTTAVPNPGAPLWDSNRDGLMFVDSWSNVDDDRHRIIILAQRQTWPLDLPSDRAMWASEAGANGQGLKVYIDDESPVKAATAYWEIEFGKGVELGPGVSQDTQETDWDEVVTDATWNALYSIATLRQTVFTSVAGAQDFLNSGDLGGSVVWVSAETSITIAGNRQLGSRENPFILVLDTPLDAVNTIDLRGTSDFYGIILVRGSAMVRGTASIWGQMLASGRIEGKGAGSTPEINYNSNILSNLNRDYIISVNIVPNTWEEFTIPPES